MKVLTFIVASVVLLSVGDNVTSAQSVVACRDRNMNIVPCASGSGSPSNPASGLNNPMAGALGSMSYELGGAIIKSLLNSSNTQPDRPQQQISPPQNHQPIVQQPQALLMQQQIRLQQERAAAAEEEKRKADWADKEKELLDTLNVGFDTRARDIRSDNILSDLRFRKSPNEIAPDLSSDDLFHSKNATSEKGGAKCSPSQDSSVVDLCSADGKDTSNSYPILNAQDGDGARVVAGLTSMANRLNWDNEKKERLIAELNSLGLASDFVPSSEDVKGTWAKAEALGQDLTIAREAGQAKGPQLFSATAGQQMSGTDCAIFALANAAGLPYGVVAARAGEIIRQASWRTPDQRAHPEQAISVNGGLNGGEVIFLAESFGHARVITPGSFAETLRGGDPILINAAGHEIVLSKAFQHNGQTWYEVVDSTQGPMRRLYMSTPELHTLIIENGVAFRADPGATVQSLR